MKNSFRLTLFVTKSTSSANFGVKNVGGDGSILT